MARLALPPEDEMTPDQAAVCAEVVSGQRGKIPSPMIAWLRNPELARRAQVLGELLRFQTTLDPALTELAILVCARHWTSHQVWTSHKRHGLSAGVQSTVIDAIAARRVPPLSGEREEVVYEVTSTLLERHGLGDDAYDRAVEVLGEQGVVELVAVIGYYGLVALTANSFQLGIPENIAPELGAAEHGSTE